MTSSSVEQHQHHKDSSSTSLLNTWLSVEQHQQQKMAQHPRITEQGGPLALAINLSTIPVKSITEQFKKNPDDAKSHPGIRTNFFIVKFLYAGWSSVTDPSSANDAMSSLSGSGGGGGPSSSARGGKGGRGGGGKQKKAVEPKIKLSTMLGRDHVVLHSFDLVNQRGTYVRSGKSEQCCILSPGMIITSKIWGNKFEKAFKDQTSDINPFDVVLVQFGTHSITSTAKENGMMLEVKSYNHLPCLSPSSRLFFNINLLPSNLQESSIARTKFVEGSHVQQQSSSNNSCEQEEQQEQSNGDDTTTAVTGASGIKGLCQEMIRANFSTSCFFIRVIPTPQNGVFSIGPDDVMKFFIKHPLVDLPQVGDGGGMGTLMVHFNPADFMFNYRQTCELNSTLEKSQSFREWIVKLFNILILMGALEMFVIVDTYKNNKKPYNNNNANGKDGQTAPSLIVLPTSATNNEGNELPISAALDNTAEDITSSSSTSTPLLDAYVRVNPSVLTEILIRANAADSLTVSGSSLSFITGGGNLLASMASHLTVIPYSSTIHVAIDTRKMTKKLQPHQPKQQEPASEPLSTVQILHQQQHSTSIIYPNSSWERAHAVYIFFEERLVHYFYIPVPLAAAGTDTSRLVLDTLNVENVLAMTNDTCEFENETPASTTATEEENPTTTPTTTVSSSCDNNNNNPLKPTASKKQKKAP